MAKIKFSDNTPLTVLLSFDSPKFYEGEWEGKKTQSYMYGVGTEDVFYATSTLHSIIQMMGKRKGSRITIEKVVKPGDEGKTARYFTVDGKSLEDAQMLAIEAMPKQEIQDSYDKSVDLEAGIHAKLDQIIDLLTKKKEDLPF